MYFHTLYISIGTVWNYLITGTTVKQKKSKMLRFSEFLCKVHLLPDTKKNKNKDKNVGMASKSTLASLFDIKWPF